MTRSYGKESGYSPTKIVEPTFSDLTGPVQSSYYELREGNLTPKDHF